MLITVHQGKGPGESPGCLRCLQSSLYRGEGCARSQDKVKDLLHVTLWGLLSHSAGGSTGQSEKNTEPWLLRERQTSSQVDKGLGLYMGGYRK